MGLKTSSELWKDKDKKKKRVENKHSYLSVCTGEAMLIMTQSGSSLSKIQNCYISNREAQEACKGRGRSPCDVCPCKHDKDNQNVGM